MVPMSLWMLLLFLSPPETPQEVLRARLEHKIRAIADGVDGVVGVTIQDLTTTERFALRGDTVFTQASAIKLPVLVELFRQVEQGRHGLDDLITLEENDVVPGSGVLQRLTPGSVRMTLRDVGYADGHCQRQHGHEYDHRPRRHGECQPDDGPPRASANEASEKK